MRRAPVSVRIQDDDIIGYKKVYRRCKDGGRTEFIVVLQIPDGAKVFSASLVSGKWRASKAKVLAVFFANQKTKNNYFKLENGPVYPAFNANLCARNPFYYKVGKVARPRGGFSETPVTCARGIHFYRTLREALDH